MRDFVLPAAATFAAAWDPSSLAAGAALQSSPQTRAATRRLCFQGLRGGFELAVDFVWELAFIRGLGLASLLEDVAAPHLRQRPPFLPQPGSLPRCQPPTCRQVEVA